MQDHNLEEQRTLLPRHVNDHSQSSQLHDNSNNIKKPLLLAGVISLALVGVIGMSSISDLSLKTGALLQRAGFPLPTSLIVDVEPASTTVYSKGTYGSADLGQQTTDEMFVGIGSVWKRECAECVDSHKLIYYKRLTPVSNSFSVYENMIETWSSEDNIMNLDFELYSSYADLVDGK